MHSTLDRITTARLSAAAALLARTLSKTAPDTLLPGETLIATIAPSPSSRLVRAGQSSKVLANLIDDFRVFLRLAGLFKIWSWAAETWRTPPADDWLKRIVWTQIAANTCYQYLENGAYLASKGVLNFHPTKINNWYVWSARFWMAHVVLEFGRLLRVRVLRRRQGKVSGGEEKEDKLMVAKEEVAWWRDVYVNAAWMPLTVHYSVEGGYVSEATVSALGLVAGLFGIRNAWRETA